MSGEPGQGEGPSVPQPEEPRTPRGESESAFAAHRELPHTDDSDKATLDAVDSVTAQLDQETGEGTGEDSAEPGLTTIPSDLHAQRQIPPTETRFDAASYKEAADAASELGKTENGNDDAEAAAPSEEIPSREKAAFNRLGTNIKGTFALYHTYPDGMSGIKDVPEDSASEQIVISSEPASRPGTEQYGFQFPGHSAVVIQPKDGNGLEWKYKVENSYLANSDTEPPKKVTNILAMKDGRIVHTMREEVEGKEPISTETILNSTTPEDKKEEILKLLGQANSDIRREIAGRSVGGSRGFDAYDTPGILRLKMEESKRTLTEKLAEHARVSDEINAKIAQLDAGIAGLTA